MAKKDRSLVIDIGSTAVHVAEFEYAPSGDMILHAFATAEFPESLTESNRPQIIGAAVRQAMASASFSDTKTASICVSGQAAFMRFVKLPPVTEDEKSVRQIVEYEARQNVPFPMDEVIWDYQLIGGEGDEDLEVMFAVIKNDIVEGTIQAISGIGLKPQLVDFAPAALYNAARANYLGEEGCAMLLDIGGRCTTLLFLDGPRFFARAIPIAGFSITQQIAKEFNISTDEAEILKRRHGFVALGGADEEPESEVAATISKIVRNVMTRLHGEINRSINVYRTQQKGNKPTQLFLSGGSAIMEFTTHFFSEKLRMEVAYFNPMRIVQVGENVDAERLANTAHLLPEVVGTALRNGMECPIEISLITAKLRQEKSFARRVPFLIVSGVIWLAILCIFLVVNHHKRELYTDILDRKTALVDNLEKRQTQMERAIRDKDDIVESYEAYNKHLLQRRYLWHDLYKRLQLAKPRDVWLTNIEQFSEDPDEGGASKWDAAKSEDKKIAYLRLRGYIITIYERESPTSPVYTRKIFSDGQVEQFEALRQNRINEMSEKERDENSAKIEPFWSDNVVTATTSLEQQFLKALKFLDNVDPDKEKTRLSSFEAAVNGIENVSNFEITVTLQEPIEWSR